MKTQIWQKLKNSTSLQLLTLAGAFTVSLAHLNLSAALTDVTDPLVLDLTLQQGNEFGISLLPEAYPEAVNIVPGGEAVSFDPQIVNNGDLDVYAFIEVLLPDGDFTIEKVSPEWTCVLSENERCVFAYGSEIKLEKIGKRLKQHGEFIPTEAPALNSTIHLDENTDLKGEQYTVSAVGYAIEADIKSTDPSDVWQIIEDTVDKDSFNNDENEDAG